MVVRGRIELPTFRFSGLRTTVYPVHDRLSVLLVNGPSATWTALDVDESRPELRPPAKTPVPWSRRAYQPFDAARNSCGMIANTTQNNQFAAQERSKR